MSLIGEAFIQGQLRPVNGLPSDASPPEPVLKVSLRLKEALHLELRPDQ
jgi:hypothetical protein